MEALRREIALKKAAQKQQQQQQDQLAQKNISEHKSAADNENEPQSKVEKIEDENLLQSSVPVEQNQQKIPTLKEIYRRLRARNEPVKLFNESLQETWQRLKKIEISQPDKQSFQNDLKNAMKKAEEKLLSDMLNSKYSKQETTQLYTEEQIVGTFNDLKSKTAELTELDEGMDAFIEFTSFIIDVWKSKLAQRSTEDKNSYNGKAVMANLIQTSEYLAPLLELLRTKQIQHDIKDSLFKILKFLLDKSYIEANNAYLELAIGNAPWPIGVTMSGIHNRPSKDKISSKNVAHVLNDETQRKYLQAFKRVMKWCQILFPTDPSRSVDYGQN